MPPELEERTLAGLHDFLEKEVVALPRSTAALDLGCGSGAWLARLQRLGFTDLCGVDAGPGPQLNGLAFIQADLDTDRPAFQKKFGLITLIEVIEHLANPGVALALIANHLEDDGVALVTSPNIHSLRCRVKFLVTGKLASFDEKGDPTHATPLLIAGFRKVAARVGLDVARCWTFPEDGTVIFTMPVRTVAGMLGMFIADPFPGDTICLKLKRYRSPKPGSLA